MELTPRPSKTPYLQIQLPPRSCLEPPLIPVLVSSIKWVAKGPWQSPICQAIKSPGFVPQIKALLPFWGLLKWKASKKKSFTRKCWEDFVGPRDKVWVRVGPAMGTLCQVGWCSCT